jgi:hypothetical protein
LTWQIRGWNRAGLKKKLDKEKYGQKSGCNPLTFFSLKRRRFDLYKKKN